MDKKKPYLAVILIQAIYAGMFLLSKAAFDGGMNNFIFVFYRQAAATVFLIPLAFFFEWKTAPPLSFGTFCKIFMLSLCGITLSLNLYGVALIYTSATLAAATTNLLPVITFFLAVLLRMEALRLKTRPGIAKMGLVLKSYPSKLLFTTLQCFLSSIQSFAIAIALERDPVEWRLGWNVRLLAVAYCGIVVTGVTFYLQALVIEKKGPVFLAMSTPLNLIFTIFCSAILLCDFVSLGSLLGGLLLILGLYSVLWGKTREQKLLEYQNKLPVHVEKECTELKVVT
ncbi:Drug/metabolite transporter [Corchorus capsularis]|uniref:WAT1-related protein n=1 Tax=Corchorus capsularis TaxID=210143 RepID=A0A1R3GCT0_COCAP|nr:Drug/metabolite transporter [Corchorus capsularis]